MHIIAIFSIDLILSFVRAQPASVCSWLTETRSAFLAIYFNYIKGAWLLPAVDKGKGEEWNGVIYVIIKLGGLYMKPTLS